MVAQQVLEIQLAVKAKLKTFMFEGSELSLRPSCNVFSESRLLRGGGGEKGNRRVGGSREVCFVAAGLPGMLIAPTNHLALLLLLPPLLPLNSVTMNPGYAGMDSCSCSGLRPTCLHEACFLHAVSMSPR